MKTKTTTTPSPFKRMQRPSQHPTYQYGVTTPPISLLSMFWFVPWRTDDILFSHCDHLFFLVLRADQKARLLIANLIRPVGLGAQRLELLQNLRSSLQSQGLDADLFMMMYRRLYAVPENLMPGTPDVTQWISDLQNIPINRVLEVIEQEMVRASVPIHVTGGGSQLTDESSLTDRTATNVADTDGRPVVPARANNQQDAGNVQLPHIARVQNISNLAGDQEEEDGHERWATE
jgi:hypothetical protein